MLRALSLVALTRHSSYGHSRSNLKSSAHVASFRRYLSVTRLNISFIAFVGLQMSSIQHTSETIATKNMTGYIRRTFWCGCTLIVMHFAVNIDTQEGAIRL
jgi:hypothetical protein